MKSKLNQRWIMMMLAVLFMGVTSIPAQGFEIKVDYRFDCPELQDMEIEDNNGETLTFYHVQMSEMYNLGAPGDPVLPYKSARILLPPGQEVEEIFIEPIGENELPLTHLIEPGQFNYDSESEEYVYVPPNEAVYGSDEPFPLSFDQGVSIHEMKGYRILQIDLCPVRYHSAEDRLVYFENLHIVVHTVGDMVHSDFFRKIQSDREWVEEYVVNPELIEIYDEIEEPDLEPIALTPDNYDMVIITNSGSEGLESAFQSYADWKTKNRGVKTVVYKMSDITSQYSGTDVPEKVRNFIKDAYKTWKIKYVLLGGDVEIIPARTCPVTRTTPSGPTTDNIPCDLYYGGLNGTWDTNNNGIYGELLNGNKFEFDLVAEVHVGRVPVNTVTDVTNFCNKVKAYEQGALSAYRDKILLLGQELSSEPTPKGTWGGDYYDYFQSKIFPSTGLTFTKLYDKTKTLSKTAAINGLNTGYHIVNPVSHGSWNWWAWIIKNSEVNTLTNTNYSFVYASHPCRSARFTENDSIGEHFIYTSHGAFSYIGNSANGLYKRGRPGGPAQQFALEVYDAMFNEKKLRIGSILQDAKNDYGKTPSTSSIADMLWTCYSVNLLGDPSTPIRMGPDLLIRDNGTDDGSLPSTVPWWSSPDIRVDAPPFGETSYEDPVFGVQNKVYVTIRNKGCQPANNVTVKLYWSDPAGGIPFSSWNLINTKTISVINSGGSVTAPVFQWTPAGTAIGHRCLLATAEVKEDPISVYVPQWDNNIGQRNINIQPKSSMPSPNTFFFYPDYPELVGERSMIIHFIDALPGTSALLRIPGTVTIEKGPNDHHITQTAYGWEVLVDPADPVDPVFIPWFSSPAKEAVELEIYPSPHPHFPDIPDFSLRLIEELDGEPIGGIDYNVR